MKKIRRHHPHLYNQLAKMLNHPFNDYRAFIVQSKLSIDCSDSREFLLKLESDTNTDSIEHFLNVAIELKRGDILKSMKRVFNPIITQSRYFTSYFKNYHKKLNN